MVSGAGGTTTSRIMAEPAEAMLLIVMNSASYNREIATSPRAIVDLGTSVPQIAQALEHRRRGGLLVQISKTPNKRLPLLSMVSLKMLTKAHSDRFGAGPALEALPVTFVAGFDFGQHSQHALYFCRQSTAIRWRQGCWFVNWNACHDGLPQFLCLRAFYT
jgi:hypothetical protein